MTDPDDENNLDGVEVHPEELLSELHRKLVQACLVQTDDEVKEILNDLDVQTVNTLLTRDILTHSANNVADNVIQLALSMNNIELLNYLVHLDGCDLEQECTDTDTPLMHACMLSNVEAVQLLLENGANVNHYTQRATPLMVAANFASKEVVSLLLANGADMIVGPAGRYTEGTSIAFYMACLRGSLEVAEVFMSMIKERNLLSEQQLVLCHTLLALQLIRQPNHADIGITLWRKALSWFGGLTKPRFGEASKVQMSLSLYALYLQESALVQSGKKIQVDEQSLLKKTHSRFPDFRLCVMPNDVRDDFSAISDTVKLHDTLLKGCASEMGPWWANANLTLYDAVGSIADGEMSIENKRLCLLILLESALHLGQSLQILSVSCNVLLSVVTKCRLYADNPGYMMLLMECIIDAVELAFHLWSTDYLAEKRKEQKNVISVAFRKTSQTVMSFAFLVLCTQPSDSHLLHLTKLISSFVGLCKKIETVEPSIFLQYTLLCLVLSYTLKSDPLELRARHGYQNLTGCLLDLLQMLLDCGVNPNARDEKGNTVMFTAIRMDEPYRSDTIELLMSYGAHVDVSNYLGQSAYKILCGFHNTNIDILDCCSLKCRAATALSFYKIPYVGALPQTLVDFVNLHDTHTPTAPFS